MIDIYYLSIKSQFKNKYHAICMLKKIRPCRARALGLSAKFYRSDLNHKPLGELLVQTCKNLHNFMNISEIETTLDRFGTVRKSF